MKYRAALLFGVIIAVALVVTAQPDSPVHRPAQALYQIKSDAAQSGWTPGRHQAAGDLAAQMGDLVSAVAHWQAAELSDPLDLRQLASAQLELEHWAGGIDTLRQLLARQPEDTFAHYHLGLSLAATAPLTARDHLLAALTNPTYHLLADELLTVIDADPADPLLAMRVGLVLFQHGHMAQAERAFRYVANLNDPYGEALAYVALSRQRQSKDSDNWMQRALRLSPGSAQVHFLHGLYQRADNALETSRAAFAQAIQLDPNQAAYYAELGIAHQLLLDYDEAAYWLNMAVVVSDNAPTFNTLLAEFYAREGYNVSSLDADQLATLGQDLPLEPELLAGYGWVLYAAGNTSGALTQLNRALDLDAYHPTALYYKARLLLDVGQLADAKSTLERLAPLDSAYQTWAQEALSVLPQLSESTSPEN
jgi:tetratricopeptide (TPR) repeat protein